MEKGEATKKPEPRGGKRGVKPKVASGSQAPRAQRGLRVTPSPVSGAVCRLDASACQRCPSKFPLV